nr:unnamed protein product [Callosobruchus chinensis]
MKQMTIAMLAAAAALIGSASCLVEPQEMFAWKEMDFAWPSKEAEEEATKSGEYIRENNLPLGIDTWKDKLFVTVPRWKAGVAASLNYIDLKSANKSAPLTPYPSWAAHKLPKEGEQTPDDHIVSVFRTFVDSCDRLWVMETGLADILGNPKQVSPPAIVIFDLNTDKVIRRYHLKPEDIKGDDSFFANIVVDMQPGKCDDAFAYIPDLGGYGIVVYSYKDNDSWRVKHNFFHFDPLQGDMTVGGVNFQWTDGVFGLALGNPDDNGDRKVFFHPLASTMEFSVNSQVLKNKTVATDPHSYDLYKIEGTKGPNSQTSESTIDPKTEVMFFTQLQKDGTACWNVKTPLEPSNIGMVTQDSDRLVFTNDITVSITNARILFRSSASLKNRAVESDVYGFS